MDYSNYISTITFRYVLIFSSLIIGLFIILCGMLYFIKQVLNNEVTKKYKKIFGYNVNHKKVDIFFSIVLIAIFVLLLLSSYRVFPDISNILNNKYIVAEGVVVSGDTDGGAMLNTNRHIVLKEFNGEEEITLYIKYTRIKKDEEYEVIYLPFSQIGAIVRKIETK